MRRFFSLLLLTGCAADDGAIIPTREDMRKRLADPAGLLSVFQDLIRAKAYAAAWDYCLATDPATKNKVMAKEAFQVGLSQEKTEEIVIRLISGLEAHAVDKSLGTMRLCNAEFGLSRDFKIALFMKRLWTFAFTPADLDYFQSQALAWFRKQVDAAGGRHYVYPPNWKYTNVIPICGCKRHG